MIPGMIENINRPIFIKQIGENFNVLRKYKASDWKGSDHTNVK